MKESRDHILGCLCRKMFLEQNRLREIGSRKSYNLSGDGLNGKGNEKEFNNKY